MARARVCHPTVCIVWRPPLIRTGITLEPTEPVVRTFPERPGACRGRRVRAAAGASARKPIGWSTIIIAALVAVSAALVLRRDGTDGVLDILTHDLSLFSGILPRVLAGCLLGAFISEILPHEKVSRSLGPKSGLTGLLIGTAFGAILPGGPFTAYPVASALLAVGADFGATIAMVVSWTLIGYGRAVAWEIPIMGTDFTLWRILISLPLPVLAGALGRFVYVRLYRKRESDEDPA
ncbi:uncharacterized membrane protein YraQ (UPF0718 family) [Bradyrhizobium ottawaense]